VWETATQLGLPVGLLIDPPQIPLVGAIAVAHPDLVIVIDHLARCRPSLQADWAGPLLELATNDHIYVKLSALDALSEQAFPFSDMWPLVTRVYNEYGANRLLWGSDWPHSRDHGSYGAAATAMRMALEDIAVSEMDAIMSFTAARLFGFGNETVADLRKPQVTGARLA